MRPCLQKKKKSHPLQQNNKVQFSDCFEREGVCEKDLSSHNIIFVTLYNLQTR